MTHAGAETYDVIVLGAGMSGLVVARRLARAGRRVLLLEKDDRVGGVIHTHNEDGFLLETGPNSFISHPPEVMAFLDDLGLGDRIQLAPMRENDRFIWYGGKLRKVPMGPGELITSDCLPFAQKLRAVSGVFRKFPLPDGDESLGSFFRPRIGDVAADRLLKPAMAGIYAADADRVSFAATLPRIFKASRTQPSLLKCLKALRAPGPRPAPKQLVSFKSGLSELPEAAARDFQEAGGRLRLGAQSTLKRNADGAYSVTLDGAEPETFEAGRIVCAVPAPAAAGLLETAAPQAASQLADVPYAALNVVHIGLAEDQLREKRDGFGFLAVRDQKADVLGFVWSDRIFPGRAPDGYRLLTGFYGGEMDPPALEWDDAELARRARQDLETTMGFGGGELRLFQVKRWERAMPVFRVGHMQRLDEIKAALPPGLTLFANYTGGISLADRIAKGLILAEEILAEG